MTKSIRDVLKNKGASIVSVSANETVYKALELMAGEDVGAVVADRLCAGLGIRCRRRLADIVGTGDYDARRQLDSARYGKGSPSRAFNCLPGVDCHWGWPDACADNPGCTAT